MTNLEQFLNKDNKDVSVNMEPASGSFSCQSSDCREVVYEGYIDKDKGKLHWECSQGHKSSVVI